MLDTIDYKACGYCTHEEFCQIRAEYMNSKDVKPGGTAKLAKNCGHYEFDVRSDVHFMGL